MLVVILQLNLSAQKRTFDIVSYTAPAGWKEEVTDSYIAYSKTSAPAWGQLAIYQSIASKGDVESDMKSEWETVVLSLHTIKNDEQAPARKINEWTMVSRRGAWTFNGADVTTILAVFSNGKTCVSILCNATAESYLNDFIQMLQTVELPRQAASETKTDHMPGVDSVHVPSIIGLWGSYNNETSGYINGMAMFTGGYYRREYVFYEDGTYLYKAKNWSVLLKEILFVYETGSYKISGDQLTLTPANGKGGWWSKAASGRTTGWGSRQRAGVINLEKVTYSFEVKYLSGMQRSYLYLRYKKPTERDGTYSNQANVLQEFSYGRRTNEEGSLVDTPPGVKTGFENK